MVVLDLSNAGRQMPKPVTLQMAWSFSLSGGEGGRKLLFH